jgi:hypothetical protein
MQLTLPSLITFHSVKRIADGVVLSTRQIDGVFANGDAVHRLAFYATHTVRVDANTRLTPCAERPRTILLNRCHVTLSLVGSLVLHDSFALSGSLVWHDSLSLDGSISLDDSLLFFGALKSRDSFYIYGALAMPDSLFLFGSLSSDDSLPNCGALKDSDSINEYWFSPSL